MTNYEIILTEDGSPSLRFISSENQEIMHHSGGAWAETWYIYGQPMQKIFELSKSQAGLQKISIASIGLGLGYNELLAARMAYENSSNQSLKVNLRSYEKDAYLTESFIDYIRGKTLSSLEMQQVYDKILSFVAGDKAKEVRKILMAMHVRGDWKILGPLEKELKKENYFNVILYDAFSSKTSPELWSEEFLTQFLKHEADDNCVLTTYACKGSLKRALKQNQFEYIERPGFMGKRNSSFAFRGFNLNRSQAG